MKYIVLLIKFIIIIFVFSCKKQKLENEFSGLSGQWKYISTKDNNGNISSQGIIGRCIEFKQKGIYKIYKNSNLGRGYVKKENSYLIFLKMSLDANRSDALSLKKLELEDIKTDTLFFTDKDTSESVYYIDIYTKK